MANAAGYLLFMPKYYFLKLLDLPRAPQPAALLYIPWTLLPSPQA